MKIQLINPNTSSEMTQSMVQSVQDIVLPSTQIIASTPLHGPKSIECAVDEVIASAALLDQVQLGKEQGVDAHIIACFGDPVPVIDGVSAAVQWAQALQQLGIKTSKVGHYAAPISKTYIGRYQHWSR